MYWCIQIVLYFDIVFYVRTIGRLVASEEAKASLVTIPPKPLIPSPKHTSAKDNPGPKSDENPKEDDQKKAESQEKESSPVLPELDAELSADANKAWAVLVEEEGNHNTKDEKSNHNSKDQKSNHNTRDEKSNHNPKDEENISDKRKETQPAEECGVSQTVASSSDASEAIETSTNSTVNERTDRGTSSERESAKGSVSEADESSGVSSPKKHKSSKRSRGATISEKLRLQQEKLKLLENPPDDVQATGEGSDIIPAKKTCQEKPSALKGEQFNLITSLFIFMVTVT